MKKPRYAWDKMKFAAHLKAPSKELIAATMTAYKVGELEAVQILDDDRKKCEYWINDIYQVEVRKEPQNSSMHLNIRRRDGGPILRDWRHFQNIKNDIVGAECEAVELYPAESRLVDTSNKFHLWCCTDPTFRFPFGFPDRDVQYDEGGKKGLRQRPL